MLEPVDHQAVAVAAETLQRDGRARHVAAQAFQFPALVGPAGHRRIERETVTRGGEGPHPLRTLSGSPRSVQAKRLAPRFSASMHPG